MTPSIGIPGLQSSQPSTSAMGTSDPYAQNNNWAQMLSSLGYASQPPVAGGTYWDQMLQRQQTQQTNDYFNAMLQQQQAWQTLVGGQQAMQSMFSGVNANPQQSLYTNPLIPPAAVGGRQIPFGQIGGPLQVPLTSFLGNYNQITDPALQQMFQSGVNGTGMPFNSWMARQQLINPQAGNWNFGMQLK